MFFLQNLAILVDVKKSVLKLMYRNNSRLYDNKTDSIQIKGAKDTESESLLRDTTESQSDSKGLYQANRETVMDYSDRPPSYLSILLLLELKNSRNNSRKIFCRRGESYFVEN